MMIMMILEWNIMEPLFQICKICCLVSRLDLEYHQQKVDQLLEDVALAA